LGKHSNSPTSGQQTVSGIPYDSRKIIQETLNGHSQGEMLELGVNAQAFEIKRNSPGTLEVSAITMME